MSYHEISVNKIVYLDLLAEELTALPSVAQVVGQGGRQMVGLLPLYLADGVDPIVALADVQQVIANHIADPGPGPIGMTQDDLKSAWKEIGRKIAVNDVSLDIFRSDAGDFHASIEQAIANLGTDAIHRRLAWMLYSTQRFLGMPMPAGYDPFNEADLVDGEWVPSGPPWA